MLALASVFFAFQSVNNAQKSLEVGQRAYLTFDVQSVNVERHQMPDGRPFLGLRTKFAIKNVGNTPALIDSAFHGVQDVRKDDDNSGTASTIWVKDISPKEDFIVEEAVPIDENSDALEYWGTVKWHDVFNHAHENDWCKEFLEMKVDNKLRILNCDPKRWPALRPYAPRLP